MQTSPNLAQLLAGAVVFAVFFTLLLSLSRAREGIRHRTKRMAVGLFAYAAATWWMVTVKHATAMAAIVVGIVAGGVADLLIPRRSRHIPVSVRRAKVREWERLHGRKFDAQKYELDHDVPFSRGGSSTPDNLKVRSRRYNRAKGARRPWWYWG